MTQDPTAHNGRGLTRRAAIGILWVLAGTGGQTALKLVVLMILARVLTPTEFGIASAAVVVVTFVAIFAQLGVAQALVQLPELGREHIVAGFHLSVAQGVAAGTIMYASAGYFDSLFQMSDLAAPVAWMSLLLPITGLQQVSEARIQRDLRFRILAAEQLVSYGVGYGAVAITLGLMGFGVWALVGGVLAQGIVRTVFLMVISPPVLRLSAHGSAYRDILRFGGGHALAQVGLTCAYQVDNLIVGRFLGAEMLGLYGRAFQAVTMPTKLLGVGLLNVLFPMMSRVKSEPERLARAFLRSMGVVVMLGLPFSMLSAILASEIVHVLLGPQWNAVVVPFQLLSVCIVFRIGHKVCEALVRACGAVYRLAWTQWFYAACVAIGAYVGHFAGLPGVAAGVAIAVTTNFLVVFALVASLLGLSFAALGRVLLRQFIVLCAIAVAVVPAIHLLRATGLNELSRLVIVCASVLLLYGSLWIVRARAFGEEGEMVRTLFGKYMPSRLRVGGIT